MSELVGRIDARARRIDLRKGFLTVLMIIPFLLGQGARYAARGVSGAVLGTMWALGWGASWLWAACLEGWHAAGPGSGGTQ